MLWLQDKLRLVEPSVKGRTKKSEVIVKKEHWIELKYSQLQRLSSTISRLIFPCFPTASPPLSRSKSAGESADFPRLFRIFCTSDCARFFPQPLRSNFGGNDGLSRKEKGRKESEAGAAAEKRLSVVRCRLSVRFSTDAHLE